ncbi:hypothetical protein PV328_009486 [Microctonus aethiopoides]|uniref:Secreted protein n=1 Tax=Microctonus aethiopoides TaxID=144406 RepID=A0AA39EXB4_9HYME|nr:hypothetical protein PV328_009486 [Microctonus aethiopoides]
MRRLLMTESIFFFLECVIMCTRKRSRDRRKDVEWKGELNMITDKSKYMWICIIWNTKLISAPNLTMKSTITSDG